MRTAGVLAGGTGIATALGAGLAAAGAMAWAVRGRTSSVFGPSLHRGARGSKAIALTFDDGPSPGTAELLQILASYKVPSTFFQCGVNVLRDPELSAAVRAAGHEIGNHSQTHPLCALKRPSFIADEFIQAQETIHAASGAVPALMRAPFGVRWFGFREIQARLGLTGVMWTVIGRDWVLDGPSVARRILEDRNPDGGIICLHDGRGTKPKPSIGSTLEAVRRIIPAMLERGYHFETVSRLCQKTTSQKTI